VSQAPDRIGVRASFMRGGTSKGLFFRWEDVPENRAERDALLCAALGSPDPYGRQLDGMGGGISSLSKAMLVRRSERAGVDVDYLFAQVEVAAPAVDYAGNCGNLSSAVGVFAVEQGYVQLPDGPGVVRMFNENTAKRVDCHLEVRAGRARTGGAAAIAGVAGQGAPIRLEFLEPGGSRTGALLAGAACFEVGLDDGRSVRASFIDAANPCVFVAASDLGLTGTEPPSGLAAMGGVLAALDHIRRAAGVLARLARDAAGVPESVPKVALVGPPAPWTTLSGETLPADAADLQLRMISMGKPHLAVPLTGALCTAVAARIEGSVVAEFARRIGPGEPLRIATPSGVVPAFAEVARTAEGAGDGWHAASASVLRTARTLMTGVVYAPTNRLEAAE
jgi:2-methylaconitate cis-trans-isomerase PrpF